MNSKFNFFLVFNQVRPVCFLFYSCCEEMVTHRAQFNSYAEFRYDCSNESRKVIINW